MFFRAFGAEGLSPSRLLRYFSLGLALNSSPDLFSLVEAGQYDRREFISDQIRHANQDMSALKCRKCSDTWDGAVTPLCPRCLSDAWSANPDIVRDKHNPSLLPTTTQRYCSVLTPDFVADKHMFFQYAAESGRWFWSEEHKKFCHFTPEPLNRIPGSGIKGGDPMPDHPLDALLIADADQSAHAYAQDQQRFTDAIHNGKYCPLPKCNIPGCDNLIIPHSASCAKHVTPPLAD